MELAWRSKEHGLDVDVSRGREDVDVGRGREDERVGVNGICKANRDENSTPA